MWSSLEPLLEGDDTDIHQVAALTKVLSQDLSLTLFWRGWDSISPGWPIFSYDACNWKCSMWIEFPIPYLTLGSMGKGAGETDFSSLGFAFAGLWIPHQIPDGFSNSCSDCLLKWTSHWVSRHTWHAIKARICWKLFWTFQLSVFIVKSHHETCFRLFPQVASKDWLKRSTREEVSQIPSWASSHHTSPP